MRDKKRLVAGILIFGSLWGFSEVIIGSTLSDLGMPSGALMTGFFALFFLVLSRLTFRQPGMQIGMGLVAGTLRMFNPLMGCHLCSAIAIMAEAMIFEIIWRYLSFDFEKHRNLTAHVSFGIFAVYFLYVSGYIITQILTPIVDGTGFYLQNLIAILPKIFSRGLLPAFIGGALTPAIVRLSKIDLTIKDRIYYPTTLGTSAFCWIVVIGSWLSVGG